MRACQSAYMRDCITACVALHACVSRMSHCLYACPSCGMNELIWYSSFERGGLSDTVKRLNRSTNRLVSIPIQKEPTLNTSITGRNSCVYLAALTVRVQAKRVHLVSIRGKELSAKRRKQLNRQAAKLNPKGGWGCYDEWV